MLYTIPGYANELFTIGSIESVDHLPHMKQRLKECGKEPAIYHMKRVIDGTRKKPYTLLCYRFKSGNFITIL